MPKHRNSADDTVLPGETLAEIHDGVSLALDALGARRVSAGNIREAQGHLRWALRRTDSILESQGASQ